MQGDYAQVQTDERGPVLMRQRLRDDAEFPPPEHALLVFPIMAEEAMMVGGYGGDLEYLIDFYEGVEISITPLVRVSHSKITDEEIREMDHVVRGALYVPEDRFDPEAMPDAAG